MRAAALAFIALAVGADGPDDARKDRDALQGSWAVARLEVRGAVDEDPATTRMTVRGDRLRWSGDRTKDCEVRYALAPGNPRGIDLYDGDKLFARGIYRLDGDTLTLCLSRARVPGDPLVGTTRPPEAVRPKAFDSRAGEVWRLERRR